MIEALYLGRSDAGIPVVVEAERKQFLGSRPATDAEWDEYENYWTEKCTRCGQERGDHTDEFEVDCEPDTCNICNRYPCDCDRQYDEAKDRGWS